MVDLYVTVKIAGDSGKRSLVLMDMDQHYSARQIVNVGDHLALGDREYRVVKIVHYPKGKTKVYAGSILHGRRVRPEEYEQLLDFGFQPNDSPLPEPEDDDDD